MSETIEEFVSRGGTIEKLPTVPEATKTASRFAKSQKTFQNEAELRVLGFLDELGVNYRWQLPIHCYIADFYLPDFHCILEVDGKTHDNITNCKRDRIRDVVLLSKGVRTYRVKDAVTKEEIVELIETLK